jgi:hypothetical protein
MDTIFFTFHKNVYSNHEHREYTFLEHEINMIRIISNALNHELKKALAKIVSNSSCQNILHRKEYYLLKYHTKVCQRTYK